MKRFTLVTVMVLICVIYNTQALAHMRCGTYVVQPGETIPSLLSKCGRPDIIEDNMWIYKLQGKFTRIVKVRHGRVWNISKGREGATIG